MLIFVTDTPQILFQIFAVEFPGQRISYQKNFDTDVLIVQAPAEEYRDLGAIYVGEDCSTDYAEVVSIAKVAMGECSW